MAPSHAIADYSTVTERSLEARFLIGNSNPIAVTIEGISSEVTDGSFGTAPTHSSESTACVTIDPPGTEQATRTICGPAEIHVRPGLGKATMVGDLGDDLHFSLEFDGAGSPAPTVEQSVFSSTVSVSRVGSAVVTIVGDVFDQPEAQWSSWYAEAKEKVKTSTSPQ